MSGANTAVGTTANIGLASRLLIRLLRLLAPVANPLHVDTRRTLATDNLLIYLTGT